MNLSGNTATKRLKAVGGIIVLGSWFDENGNVVTATNDHRTTTGFNDILIENNVIQRVGLEGIRTKADSDTSRGNTFYKTFSNITIRNNYLEDIGDGLSCQKPKVAVSSKEMLLSECAMPIMVHKITRAFGQCL